MKIYWSFIFFALLFTSCAFQDPYFMTIEIYENRASDFHVDERQISIDNHWANIEDIPIAVYLEIKDLDSIQKSKFFVKLKINKNASMGIVSDVKYELVKAKIENIRYYYAEEKRIWVDR